MKRMGSVLVIDDDQAVRKVVERILELQGFEVLTAGDGRAGLTAARRQRPDVIILDIVMPNMDGFEVFGHLQRSAHTASIPVLMLTGDGRFDPRRFDGYDVGPAAFLTKPIGVSELTGLVQCLVPALPERRDVPPAAPFLAR